jgi:DNA mismatch repair protein MutL
LNLAIDPTQVDVNVHPRKSEIRFANEQNIFRAIYHSIQDTLDKVSLINEPQLESINNNVTPHYSTNNFSSNN